MVSFFVTVVFDRIPMSKDNASITFLTVLILPSNVFILDGFCLLIIQEIVLKQIKFFKKKVWRQ